MDKATALDALNRALCLSGVNRSVIARAVGVDPSQVSRIASGKFAKLDGHALRVCKYASTLLHHEVVSGSASELEAKLLRIASINPEAADAVATLIDALADVYSPPHPADGSRVRQLAPD